MILLTVAMLVAAAAAAITVVARERAGGRRTSRYWSGIAEILDDDTLTGPERDRALESAFAARPF